MTWYSWLFVVLAFLFGVYCGNATFRYIINGVILTLFGRDVPTLSDYRAKQAYSEVRQPQVIVMQQPQMAQFPTPSQIQQPNIIDLRKIKTSDLIAELAARGQIK